jgi:ATP synthase protein I
MKQIGIFMTIPFVLGVPPLIGWYLGHSIDMHFHTEPYFMNSLIVLGVVAGFREVYRIIKRFGNEL